MLQSYDITRKQATYGTWTSSLTADRLTEASIRPGQIFSDKYGNIYLLEERPNEKRTALVKIGSDGVQDLLSTDYDVRSQVHEYGGGALLVTSDGTVYFSNKKDGRIYCIEHGLPRAITGLYNESEPEACTMRYADFIYDESGHQLYAVREDHSKGFGNEVNTLVRIPLDGSAPFGIVVASGADFYSSPRLNDIGTKLAWIEWDNPNMPWDKTSLYVADLDGDGNILPEILVAGGPSSDISVCQPHWQGDILYYISDVNGFWNIFGAKTDSLRNPCIELKLPADCAGAQWNFGMSSYTFLGNKVLVTMRLDGVWKLVEFNLQNNPATLQQIESQYQDFRYLTSLNESEALMVAASPSTKSKVVKYNLNSGEFDDVRDYKDGFVLDDTYISLAQSMYFPIDSTEELIPGMPGKAHLFYFPPTHPLYESFPGELPPLIIESHGGPTSSYTNSLDLRIQYFTTRGFGFALVNYRGSDGFGGKFRRSLAGNWGVYDIEDCIAAANYLVDQGVADRRKLLIQGRSAGGYSTMACLVMHKVFAAGASFFGVSDLEALLQDTHKFERHYLDGIIADYPGGISVYKERSPINHVDDAETPMIILQGSKDKIVLPNQSQGLRDVLKEKGIPVAYLEFGDEGHGFRNAPNIKASLEGSLYFYLRVLGLEPPAELPAIEIFNL